MSPVALGVLAQSAARCEGRHSIATAIFRLAGIAGLTPIAPAGILQMTELEHSRSLRGSAYASVA
jgi:hypothetical protein